VRDDLAVIQTIDFFPPIVDDAYAFGQIAAANSISDVYAMGGTPKTALNLFCAPAKLDLQTMRAILEGGADKAFEAGILVSGGHSINDDEPKYGMAVTGFAHPSEIRRNSTAREGDLLVLTKPLGIGAMTTAMKADELSEAQIETVIAVMSRLNRYAAEAASGLDVSSCTDITGFGLIGHTGEMAKGSKKTIELYSSGLPLVEGAFGFADEGFLPGGAYRNQDHFGKDVLVEENVVQTNLDLMYDPQTSGGLLIAIHEKDLNTLLARLGEAGDKGAVIGRVLPQGAHAVIIRP
jgi:selenide,water dikinase